MRMSDKIQAAAILSPKPQALPLASAISIRVRGWREKEWGDPKALNPPPLTLNPQPLTLYAGDDERWCKIAAAVKTKTHQQVESYYRSKP